MEYFLRKFQRSKWEILPFMVNSDIQADAIGGCLKTSNNTLSLWKCSDDEADIEEIVLAIVTTFKRIDKIHVILFKIEDISDKSFELVETLGSTPVVDLKERHVDVVNLTSDKLREFACFMKNKVRSDIKCHMFTKEDVAKILCKAIEAKRIELHELNEELKIKVEERLSSS